MRVRKSSRDVLPAGASSSRVRMMFRCASMMGTTDKIEETNSECGGDVSIAHSAKRDN